MMTYNRSRWEQMAQFKDTLTANRERTWVHQAGNRPPSRNASYGP